MDETDIKNFVRRWTERGNERGDSQKFWLELLRDVLDINDASSYIDFEVPVQLKHKSFIDAFIPDTKVLIEQKSLGRDLNQPIVQSDGTKLTPYEQAKRYGNELPYSLRPRWIIACNFREFLIYDMEKLDAPLQILLQDLPEKFHLLEFLVDRDKIKLREEENLSVAAGKVVDNLYETLKKNYIHPDHADTLQSLNKLCVRLVFCLYAESAGIFGKHKIFTNYLENENDIRRGLIDLFRILNTPESQRDPYDDRLNQFPYVNGGLFADGAIEIPRITPATRDILLNEICTFKWKDISPTIFGAVFESTINAKTRRTGGMHYTSPANIHKVIDTLFLNDLRDKLKNLTGRKALLNFQNKLASIKILDPACGSGNFLTESFLSLRRLENEILRKLFGAQILLGEFDNPVKVSINQFYGIEIDDFAVAVAKTALWISELQMLAETAEIVHKPLKTLPLRSYPNIHLGNALTGVWGEICPVSELTYIVGNPPFVGHQWRTAQQVDDMKIAFHDLDKHGKLDYVCAWYNKTADFIAGTNIRCAFVSTNSICQGESVSNFWKFFFGKPAHIDFAHQSFKWDSESDKKAQVHVIIVGFSTAPNDKPKLIFDADGNSHVAQNINGYLLDAPNIFIENRGNPLNPSLPKMTKGSQPTDGGYLLLTADERAELIARNPLAEKFIRRFIGAEEFINGKERYCLWLVDATPSELRRMPLVMERLAKVAAARRKSATKSVRAAADTPALFTQIRQPDTNYLVVPAVSSENRNYVPIGFLTPEIIASNQLYMIPDATLYQFGVLTSSVHMAWLKVVCGRLEMRYRYAPAVYNNFPWCAPTAKQKAAIELTAQTILDVRAGFADSILADLYNELTMPKILRDTHRENDRAVLAAYGFIATAVTENL